jgi:hypothetical protein
MDRIGIRCLQCNTDVWLSPLEINIKYCKCGGVNIANDGAGGINKGNKKGVPHVLLKEVGGKVKVVEPIDTTRAPVAPLGTTLSKKRS